MFRHDAVRPPVERPDNHMAVLLLRLVLFFFLMEMTLFGNRILKNMIEELEKMADIEGKKGGSVEVWFALLHFLYLLNFEHI